MKKLIASNGVLYPLSADVLVFKSFDPISMVDRFGLCSITGRMITPAIYDDLQLFPPERDNLIRARYKGKTGFIDFKGEVKIPFIFDGDCEYTCVFINGNACLKINGYYGVIDCDGNVIQPFIYTKNNSNPGGLLYFDGESFGDYVISKPSVLGSSSLLTRDGTKIVSALEYFYQSIDNDRYIAGRDNAFGKKEFLFDTKTRKTILECDRITVVGDAFITIEDNKCNVLDINLKPRIIVSDQSVVINHSYYHVCIDGKWGIAYADGSNVIDCIYEKRLDELEAPGPFVQHVMDEISCSSSDYVFTNIPAENSEKEEQWRDRILGQNAIKSKEYYQEESSWKAGIWIKAILTAALSSVAPLISSLINDKTITCGIIISVLATLYLLVRLIYYGYNQDKKRKFIYIGTLLFTIPFSIAQFITFYSLTSLIFGVVIGGLIIILLSLLTSEMN